jgi:hypothetical protein
MYPCKENGAYLSVSSGRRDTELHRLKGQLLLQSDAANERKAEDCFCSAIEVARSQQARFWELRTPRA